MSDKDSCVKWPIFATLLVTMFCLILGTATYVLSTTISGKEFVQYEKRMDEKIDRVIEAIKNIKK